MQPLLLLVLLVAVVIPSRSEAKSFSLSGKLHRRMAADLRAAQQQRRAARPHENFEPRYGSLDELLIANISINKTNQTFAVSIETDADLLFFLDPTYPTLQPGQPTYSPNASGGVETSYFAREAGENDVFGPGYADVVNFDDIGVWNQSFAAIVRCDGDNPPFVGLDGELGLAWDPSGKDDPPNPFLAPILNIFGAHPDLPRFYVLWLQQDKLEGKRELEWAISFGGDIHSKCTEEPLASAGLHFDDMWQTLFFKLDTFGFGTQQLDGDVAVVDSGTPVIQLPIVAFQTVHATLQPDFDFDLGVYTTACSNAGVFPAFLFTIGGEQLAVPSTNYIVDLQLGGGKCVVAFDLSFFLPYVLGTPFQWTFCTKFDVDNSEISFHNLVD